MVNKEKCPGSEICFGGLPEIKALLGDSVPIDRRAKDYPRGLLKLGENEKKLLERGIISGPFDRCKRCPIEAFVFEEGKPFNNVYQSPKP